GEVQKGLGELREAASKVYEVGRDVASLRDILRAPNLRGGLGELLRGDLLAQGLPPAHFTRQRAFRSDERVDAYVRWGGWLVPVARNCFYAYLQAIALGLRGLRIEGRAEEVMGLLARLGGDLDRLKEDFRLVGKHLTNAAAAHAAAERRIERLGGKLAAIGGEEPVEEGPRQALLLRSS